MPKRPLERAGQAAAYGAVVSALMICAPVIACYAAAKAASRKKERERKWPASVTYSYESPTARIARMKQEQTAFAAAYKKSGTANGPPIRLTHGRI